MSHGGDSLQWEQVWNVGVLRDPGYGATRLGTLISFKGSGQSPSPKCELRSLGAESHSI